MSTGSSRKRRPTDLNYEPPADEADSTPEGDTAGNNAGTGEVVPEPCPRCAEEIPTIEVSIPLADPPDSQVSRISAHHLDVQLRDPDTRRAFMRIWGGLIASNAKLKDGLPVVSYADAGRWMIQQVELRDRRPVKPS